MSDGPPVAGFWRVAEGQPDTPAVIDADNTVTTYGELLARARGLARGLRTLGLERGDHFSMLIPNHRAFFEVLLAATESGLCLTPVNTHLAGPEVAHVVSDSDSKVLIAHESLAEIAVAAADQAGLPAERRLAVGAIAGFRPYEELLVGGAEPLEDRSPGTTMMYTSGTTGKPKGVGRRLVPNADPDAVFGGIALVTAQGFGVPTRHHHHLVNGPLYHAGPFVGGSNAIHLGATAVLMDKWTPEGALELIDRYRVESTQMVPTMFHRLLALPDEVKARYDVSSIKSVFHTGAPCPVEIKQRMMDWWGPVVYETYGGTEGAATIATPRRWLQKPGTVGKAIFGVRVRILGDDGEERGPGEVGEICIESDMGPSEYYKDGEKTARMRRGERGITLGDVGYLDEDGYLFICDRKIDMIIAGGVNIYPAEVEAALLEDPAIADAAVIGVPNDEWGEEVKAIVELKPGVAAGDDTAAAIIEGCRTRIARFKCPRSVDFVAALPRQPNGKVEKRRLREPYWAERERAI